MISAACIRPATSRYESVKTPAARKPPLVGDRSHTRILGFLGYCGLNTAVSEPVCTIIQISFAPKRPGFDPTIRHCALHHSAVISLNFVICSIATSPGFGSLRILSTKGRHGVACEESPPYSVSPPLAGDTKAPIAASQAFFSRRGDRLHPSQFTA